MHLIIGLIFVLVALLLWTEVRRIRSAYSLKRNHLDSLVRLDERIKAGGLRPADTELVSAAIDEVIGEV